MNTLIRAKHRLAAMKNISMLVDEKLNTGREQLFEQRIYGQSVAQCTAHEN